MSPILTGSFPLFSPKIKFSPYCEISCNSVSQTLPGNHCMSAYLLWREILYHNISTLPTKKLVGISPSVFQKLVILYLYKNSVMKIDEFAPVAVLFERNLEVFHRN